MAKPISDSFHHSPLDPVFKSEAERSANAERIRQIENDLKENPVRPVRPTGKIEPVEKPVWTLPELLIWAFVRQRVHKIISFSKNDYSDCEISPTGLIERIGELGVRVDNSAKLGHALHADAVKIYEIVSALTGDDADLIISSALLEDFPVHQSEVVRSVQPVYRPNGKLKHTFKNGRINGCQVEIVEPDEGEWAEIQHFSKLFDMIVYALSVEDIRVCNLYYLGNLIDLSDEKNHGLS